MTVERFGLPPTTAEIAGRRVRGRADVIVATSVYDALQRVVGDANPRPIFLVIGANVVRAEVIVLAGNQVVAGNTTWGSNDLDVLTLVRVEGTLTINAGVNVTTPVRKLGLAVYSTSDATVNGILHMDGMGGIAPGVALPIDAAKSLSAAGAAGGAQAATGTVGNNGSAGSGQQSGGGGSGGGGSGAVAGGTGGAGAAGRCWCGGPGGAAGNYADAGGAASEPLQQGGGDTGPSWYAAGGGGGAGVIPGYGGSNSNGTSPHPVGAGETGGRGAGGLLVLIAGGNVTIGAAGRASADGKTGGRGGCMGSDATGQAPGSGGGGSGGGIVLVLRVGTYTNNGTVRANGGAAGPVGFTGSGTATGRVGGAGGAGTVTTGTVTP